MGQISAFFDMDETIVATDTIFAFFEIYSKREKAETIYEWSKNDSQKVADLYKIPVSSVYPGMDVELIIKEIIEENNGIPIDVFDKLTEKLPLFDEVIDFFKEYKTKYGNNIFIVSSSFEPIAKGIAKRIGVPVENVFATKLKVENNKVTEFIGPVMEAKYKEDIVRKVIIEKNLSLKSSIGVGDGKHDYYFIRAITNAGGLGVAVSDNELLIQEGKPQVIMKKPNYSIISKEINAFAKNNQLMNTDNTPKIVSEMLSNIQSRGDVAVIEYNTKFDKNNSPNFEVTKEQIKEAYTKVDKETINALKFAANNIRTFAIAQNKQLKSFKLKSKSLILEQRIIPIEKVGCYVPGGNYPLPSTALMTVIPAKVGGVKEVIVCSPKISHVTIVASDIAGATKIFNLGGVQAIGAMAYGTKQVPKVNKIVGPGNKYVAEAKRQVFGSVGIDFIAGPSEVLIIADDSANPKLIAADLLAQAEHDVNAIANLITTSNKIAKETKLEIEKQLAVLPTKDIAKQSIEKSRIIEVKTLKEAIVRANEMAPEHLELQVKNPNKLTHLLINYGSLFVGQLSAEALGDYCLGPNHTLPTSKAAKYTGGLSVRDFVKIVTSQTVLKTNKRIVSTASKLAEIEGLMAHKNSADLREKL